MIKRLSILMVLLISGLALSAQQKLPVINASFNKVDIKDGKVLKKGHWTIVPEAKPDIYTTSARRVTFYTDMDSISFKIRPGKVYNFIILLNGKDSAYTQIKYEPAVYTPSYLDILKKGSKYNSDDTREITKYTYTPVSDPDLIKIRREFRLDSVIGTGNEISQILNLLHWVHNAINWDGSKDAPEASSISNLMSICMKDNKPLNCGALATVLNDSYLALGFKSRRIVCLPKDSTDFDCHSINAVYSKTLNKWLWIDPTNDAYVMNEKGDLLSIAEVRERLVNGKPLILNPEANLNHKYSVTPESYLYNYMAKNLYAFECFVSGGGKSESNLLLPVEYKGIIPRTRDYNPKCTSNPAVFWAKPE